MADTVAALATPWGRSALAVVRVSGPDTVRIAGIVLRPMRARPLAPGAPRRVRLVDEDGPYDDGVVVLGEAPATYTGEDTAEITCHGNPVIVERLLAAIVAAGGRIAAPGEFTRRALVAGKIDLVGAEAILQISRAATARGVDIGRAGLDGALSADLAARRQGLVEAAAELEARLDYPGDELGTVDDDDLVAALADWVRSARALAATFRAGRLWVHGARVALVGAVNAGKSSLFNALLGRDRALVHDLPGTTRDVLEVATVLDGLAVTLLDTAGERATDDAVEAAGLALARELVGEADGLIVVLRARAGGPSEVERAILARTADRPRVVVYNGVDALGSAPPPEGALPTVATTGQGVDRVRTAVRAALVGEEPAAGTLILGSARQRDALVAAATAVDRSIAALPTVGVAAAADDLTEAIGELDALTGADTREDVLDALFSRFCIGK